QEVKRTRQAREALDRLTAPLVAESPGSLTEREREFLEGAARAYEGFSADPADDPDGKAGVASARFHAGLIYRRLGQLPAAAAASRQAVALCGPLADESPDEPAHRAGRAASAHALARTLRDRGRAAEAEAEATAALEGFRTLVAADTAHLEPAADCA